MIVNWFNNETKKTFKFIGYTAAETAEEKCVIIKKHLGANDNINTICKKLVVYLHKYIKVNSPDNIYLWTRKKVSPNSGIALHFIENIFQYESNIDKDYFATCIQNTFEKTVDLSKYNMIDKTIALSIMSRLKYSSMVDPLMFRYTKDGYLDYSLNYDPIKGGNVPTKGTISDYLPLTLGDVEEINMVVNNGKISEAYFPLVTHVKKYDDLEKFINQIDKAEQKVLGYELTHDFNNKTYVSFAYYRTEHANNINLHALFDKFHASSKVPFIKFKARNNIFYKVHKESLVNIESKNLEKWTLFKTTANIQLVSFKIAFNKNSFCTFTITESLVDIKFNLSINDRVKYTEICKFFKTTLNELFSNLVSLEIDNYKCLNMITYNVVSMETSTIKYDKIKDIIENTFYLYFNMIPNPDKNILHMQYKKVDNYSKYDNIQNFMLQCYTLPKDVVIVKLMENFSFSKQEAESEYDKWANKSELEALIDKTGKKKLKLRYDNFVNIKLKIADSIDAKFMVSGLKDYKIMHDILNLMNILFDQQKVTKTAAINKEDIDKVVYDAHAKSSASTDLPDISDLADIADLTDLTNLEDLDYDDEEEAMKEFEASKVAASAADAAVVKTMDAKGKIPGYVLGLLREADNDLFNYKSENNKKRQDYPSICGAVDKRQPIVIDQKIKDNIDKKYPGAYDNYMQTGSTPELAQKNIYICPKIWCPKSQIAMNYDQYKTAKEKCPLPDEEPILFVKDNETDIESALRSPYYVNFLRSTIHPKKFCLPCCFRTKKKPSDCITNLNTQKTSVDITGNEKYIKADTYFPLENNRYGLLSKELLNILGGEICGNHHNGTGLMKNNSSCYLRKGITQTANSFLDCVSAVLQEQDFLQRILNKLNIANYLALENGKIVRLFINENFDMHNPDNFQEFKTWFLEQDAYIKKFNLIKVQKELEKASSNDKDVIREFMIYNSFKHYKMFLENNEQIKDHRTMLDFININFNQQHFIIVEVNPITGQGVILCPFNRQVKNAFNPANPVFFIVKNNAYYEPLCHVTLKEGVIQSKYAFSVYKDPQIKTIVDFYVNNCAATAAAAAEDDLLVFIESLSPIRAHVIDFNFKVRGVLTKQNLYIPFVNKLEIYSFTSKSFIYYNDIVDFKCLLSKDEIKGLYNKILKYTGNDFYKIAKFITSNEQISAVVLKTGTVVPVQMKRSSLLMRNFENDLQIFIEEKTPAKKSKIQDVNFDIVLDLIEKDEEIKHQVEFLTAHHNPFPKAYRRDKLYKLLNIPHKLIEMLLTGSKMVRVSKIFNVVSEEALLDQYDITNKRLDELIENQKNPFKMLSEKLIEFEEGHGYVYKDNKYTTPLHDIYKSDDLKNLPVTFASLLKDYGVFTTEQYDPTTTYILFINVNSVVNPNRKIDNVDLLKNAIRTRLINDYKTDKIRPLFDRNESFVKLYKKDFGKITENTKPLLANCISIFDSLDYHVSFYELSILSELVGVNLIILGRKSVKRPDGIEVLQRFNDALPFTMIMVHNHDRVQKLERFDLVVKKDGSGAIFRKNELPRELINKTKGLITIDVED